MFFLLFLHSAYGTIHIWKLIKNLFFIKNFLTKILTLLVICLANLIWTKSFISSAIKLSSWKLTLLNDNGNCQNIEYLSHHLIKNNQILALEKRIPKELYSLSIFLKTEIPTSQKYFIRLFPNLQCDWKGIYFLTRKVTIDTKLRIFQYKLLNNILHLNKHLFMFRKKDTKHCSFCKLQDETIIIYL